MCGTDIFLCLLSVLFPPIGVWVKRGICSADSLINIGLCCLGFLPGLLHAWYIIYTYPDLTYEAVAQDSENGTVTYYYVQHGPAPRRSQQYQSHARPNGYGTLGSSPSAQFPGQQSGTKNSFPAPQQHTASQQPNGGNVPAAGPSTQSGGEAHPPPSYADVIKGDHKVQSHE